MVNMYTYRLPCTEELMRELYVEKNMSQEEIADHLGTSQKVIWRAMRKMGIPRRRQIKRNQEGSNNAYWKGGRTISSAGYVYVRSKNHPRSSTHGYVFEHILVMEEKIGRHLRDGEIIHHINGDKKDNRPENLKLTTLAGHFREHGRTPKGYMRRAGGDV